MNSLACNIFIRGLALSYLLAFGSLFFQIKALFGINGILPISQFLNILQSKGFSFMKIPSIFWFNSSDSFLLATCIAGIILSIYLLVKKQYQSFDLMEFLSLALLYLFYLSFITVGQDFLSFQWDILLLETGFLTVVFVLFKSNEFGRTIFTWLFRFLVFKLIFMSGLVKISSQDINWNNLTALNYHYYTQPLPNPVSYFMHQLPGWFHRLSTLVMFIIELIVPFFIFCRPRLREIAAIVFIAFQLILIITGNYCFFNLLTIILCLWLFDDLFLKKLVPESIQLQLNQVVKLTGSTAIFDSFIENRLTNLSSINQERVLNKRLIQIFLVSFAILMISLDCYFIFSRSPIGLTTRTTVIKTISPIISPWRYYFINNAYGLFASMTIKRREIIIQGAGDDMQWRDYEFYFKPQNPKFIPAQVAPYQPRLDWQMWFAALQPIPPIWFIKFVAKLLEADTTVLTLLKTNPFPEQAPKYIRAIIYDYQFTNFDEYTETGNYWKTKLLGTYLPQMSLKMKQ